MNRQRGVIAILYLWIAGVIAATIIGLSIAVKVQTARLEAVKAEYSAFKAQVAALGEAAAKEAARVNLANQKAKEVADAKTKALLVANADLGKRLRDARSNSGFLPKPPADSRSPQLACFQRTELESALQRLDAGVSELIGEGATFQLRLATAAEWAKSLAK